MNLYAELILYIPVLAGIWGQGYGTYLRSRTPLFITSSLVVTQSTEHKKIAISEKKIRLGLILLKLLVINLTQISDFHSMKY